MAKPKKSKAKPDFHRQMVLFQWALGKFGVKSLKEFCERFQLTPNSPEGLSEHTGRHRFFEAIINALPTAAGVILAGRLEEYEQNLLKHTQAINTGRLHHGQPKIDWKYHQYLGLLFTEMFLDQCMSDPGALREEINAQIEAHNAQALEADRVDPYPPNAGAKEQIARLAFWCATGSGKTLLMHMHVLQFQHYHKIAFNAGRWPKLDQIILITPNDGLSDQHAKELVRSGFDPPTTVGEQGVEGLFAGVTKGAIKIISIHSLREEHGTKTVATEAFEGCNLVLVDEGHRGAGRGEEGAWLMRREQVARGGFLIEYSATFKEAVGNDDILRHRYARSILFDYAYRSFYRDGYGKDFSILNLEDDTKQRRYLTAALLLFYQQMKVWKDGGTAIKPFLIDKPLWVFVGHTVIGKLSSADDAASISDVVEVLRFFSSFLTNNAESIALIQSLLEEGFKDQNGRDLLIHRMPHIDIPGNKASLAKDLHDGILREIFHAPGGGALAVQLLKSAAGELAVKVGESKPFGVVNVGDPAAVAEACAGQGIVRLEDDVNRESLFETISRDDSPINLLVGSRKFTEGWNSWRVSSIGLMRMGKNEGTQIIQLFGRGIRLRGYAMSLRRSSELINRPARPTNLRQVETLQVFGVKANYMNTFRDWILSEVPEAMERQVWDLPVVKTMPNQRLKTLKLKDVIEGEKVERGQAFVRLGPLVKLRPPHPTAPEDAWLRGHRTRLNWLPRIRGLVGEDKSITSTVGGVGSTPEQKFTALHVLLMDKDELLFGLEAFKAVRGLDRLHVDRAAIDALLKEPGWYELLATADDMRTDRYENRGQWQRMAQQLINSYTERFYRFLRGRWEAPYIEVVEVDVDEQELGYTIETTELVQSVAEVEHIAGLVDGLKKAFASNTLAAWSHWGGQWKTVPFAGHLFQPLMYAGKNLQIKISPIPLDKHESRFVEDLASWCSSNPHEVFLLRNQAVSGLGFFQASNFFPDFLLWTQIGNTQHLVFVDPKGLLHLDPADPKIQFATRDIPRLQQIISTQSPDLMLHAFILSNSPFASLGWSKGSGNLMSKAEIEALCVLFQADDPTDYVTSLMHSVMQATAHGEQVQLGRAIAYLNLLLQLWGKPVIREALEASLIFVLNDVIRRKVLKGVSSAHLTKGGTGQFIFGMNFILSNMQANGVIHTVMASGRTVISIGAKPISIANMPLEDVAKAKEAIQAVKILGESRTAAEYAEVIDVNYELVQ